MTYLCSLEYLMKLNPPGRLINAPATKPNLPLGQLVPTCKLKLWHLRALTTVISRALRNKYARINLRYISTIPNLYSHP